MKRKKTQFEIEIIAAKEELGHTWESLSSASGGKPNNGNNLNKQIANKSIGDERLEKVCEALELDFLEMYKIKRMKS